MYCYYFLSANLVPLGEMTWPLHKKARKVLDCILHGESSFEMEKPHPQKNPFGELLPGTSARNKENHINP